MSDLVGVLTVVTLNVMTAGNIGVRDGGSRGGGSVDPPKFGQIRHLFRQKTTHLFD